MTNASISKSYTKQQRKKQTSIETTITVQWRI